MLIKIHEGSKRSRHGMDTGLHKGKCGGFVGLSIMLNNISKVQSVSVTGWWSSCGSALLIFWDGLPDLRKKKRVTRHLRAQCKHVRLSVNSFFWDYRPCRTTYPKYRVSRSRVRGHRVGQRFWFFEKGCRTCEKGVLGNVWDGCSVSYIPVGGLVGLSTMLNNISKDGRVGVTASWWTVTWWWFSLLWNEGWHEKESVKAWHGSFSTRNGRIGVKQVVITMYLNIKKSLEMVWGEYLVYVQRYGRYTMKFWVKNEGNTEVKKKRAICPLTWSIYRLCPSCVYHWTLCTWFV